MPPVEEVGFPDELIMNYWLEQFFQYVGIEMLPLLSITYFSFD